MLTVKQTRAIKAHIIKHHEKYTQGYTMTYKRFRQIAGFLVKGLKTAEPNNMKDAYKFIAAQAKLNKILMQKGLKLTSSNYYTEWHVAPNTPTEVKRMAAKSTAIRTSAFILRTGYAINRGNPLAEV